ncbi:MAG: DUF2490 domain-containing protein [Nitrospira sp.]|nr:DUF2490 domain-containing protein [Nitrospira sp.]MDH4328965.1 DUF2490 domain-containing protein [Nitrospira sp.]
MQVHQSRGKHIEKTATVKRKSAWYIGLLFVGVMILNLTGGGVTTAQAYTELGPNTQSDFRLWTPVYLTVKLPSRFLAYMEVNPRIGDDVTNIDQLLLRPALGYQLTENLSLWQGYGWVGNFNQKHTPPQSPFFQESRAFQQAIYTDKFSSFNFMSRTRMEERWIGSSAGTALRFRQMLKVSYPLPMAPDWSLVGYDEIFINLNSVDTIDDVRRGGKAPGAGIDQNRFFLGVNKKFNQYFNVDIGYQNQMLNSRTKDGNANLINHILLLQFYFNL